MAHGGDIYSNKVNIDFSVNLSPVPVHEDILRAMDEGDRRAVFYPDHEQEALREALAKHAGVAKNCALAGNGASELIMASVRALNPERALLTEPCYNGYRYVLESIPGCSIEEYLLSEENGFELTEDILSYITSDIDVLFLTDPWNPTGKNIDGRLLDMILAKASDEGVKVILDQSFILLSVKAYDRSVISEYIGKYDNLIVIRSFTKFLGLPGIRTGYVISSDDNIRSIRRCLPEWNVSAQAEEVMKAGIRLADNRKYIDNILDQIRSGREYLTKELKSLGFKVYDSDTAYILLGTEYELYENLLEKGILIRDCSDYKGLKKGYYRIAVKDAESDRLLINTIKAVLPDIKKGYRNDA